MIRPVPSPVAYVLPVGPPFSARLETHGPDCLSLALYWEGDDTFVRRVWWSQPRPGTPMVWAPGWWRYDENDSTHPLLGEDVVPWLSEVQSLDTMPSVLRELDGWPSLPGPLGDLSMLEEVVADPLRSRLLFEVMSS